jgi:hypothetical protein
VRSDSERLLAAPPAGGPALPVRDPRVDPRPGDEIFRELKTAKDGGIIRAVTRAHGGFVFCTADNGYKRRRLLPMTLAKWRKWARKAEIGDCADLPVLLSGDPQQGPAQPPDGGCASNTSEAPHA